MRDETVLLLMVTLLKYILRGLFDKGRQLFIPRVTEVSNIKLKYFPSFYVSVEEDKSLCYGKGVVHCSGSLLLQMFCSRTSYEQKN